MKCNYRGIVIDDESVINLQDAIWDNEYNPHQVRPWQLYHLAQDICIVFASCEQDALDFAADSGKLETWAISPASLADMSETEQENLSYLGNDCGAFNIDEVSIRALPIPSLSFVALFNAYLQDRM